MALRPGTMVALTLSVAIKYGPCGTSCLCGATKLVKTKEI